MYKPTLLLSVLAASLALALVPADSSAWLILAANRRFPGGSSLTVDCPVLSNRLSGTASADLWYLDNSTSSINCTYRSEDKLSTAVNQQSLSSVGDDNLYRKMTFTVNHFGDGYTHIRCTIPPRDSTGNASFIVGYAGF
jgi:hypothetical protein